MADVVVIGGGLAGSEASWQLAKRGMRVVMYEMRPVRQTPAHKTGFLAELVCSNSLGSSVPDRAPGLLKTELEVPGFAHSELRTCNCGPCRRRTRGG